MAAIKTAKTYVQIGLGLEAFKEPYPVEDIPFMLMGAIGASPTILQRYREGRSTVASFDGLLVKNILAYRLVDTKEMNDQLEEIKRDRLVQRNRPAIIAVSDGEVIKAFDPAVEETYENHLDNLYTDYEFFSPMWGVRKIRNIEENDADVKAAYKMARIHDEIRRHNHIGITDDTHDLNIFMSRLLFCFFAEDTGIFEKDLFTNAINNTTRPDASDLQEFFDGAFRTMDLQLRVGVNSRFAQFPYVNGGLFSKVIQIPKMNVRIRKLILECGNLNWAKINPDIFGSMIQAVVSPELRSGLGMHYTSVSNIKKVINPLFLDELYDEYHALERKQKEQDSIFDQSKEGRNKYYENCKSIIGKCRKLLQRMQRMKFFDPACGSGNFLIITYKELRMLEMKILKLIQRMTPNVQMQFVDGSLISINQFYGLEINDFAVETAVLSLWLAEHQMNSMFIRDFGVNIKALPLKQNHNFHCGNACREDWNKVCPHKKDEEVYVMGNPPYIGTKWQKEDHKKDVDIVMPNNALRRSLDYISCWFILGSKYIQDSQAKCAFVSTNSICQGEQVPALWPCIEMFGVQIEFCYTSFKWTNNAKYNAGVTCVIIGLTAQEKADKYIYSDRKIKVDNINYYLIDAPNVIVSHRSTPLSNLPVMTKGSQPTDGGFLLMDSWEKQSIEENYPYLRPYIRKYMGADDMLNRKERYCFWLKDCPMHVIENCPELIRRIEGVKKVRSESTKEATRKWAQYPHLFTEDRQPEFDYIILPVVSSERRMYVPVAFNSHEIIANTNAQMIPNAPLYVFGIVSSLIHNVWMKTVCGRLELRYAYSASIVYNTFPFPAISSAKKQEIEDAALEVLGAREAHYEKTLAELYDPETMPDDLREAHHNLDLIVDSCYRERPFADENERLEWLLKLYEKMNH